MAIVTGDRYLDLLARFVEQQAAALLDGGLVLKLNPVGLHYVQTRLEALQELEQLRNGAPVDYLRAYVADLGDHRALEQLRSVLRLLGSLQVVAVLPFPARDPTPTTLLPFARLRSLELRGCDLSTSAARGLLELRPILEKLICYNSADALRHIFAERTVEIKDAKVWSKLAAVACVCNGMLLMDDSLHLLPAVEALDLSRNRFAKVANLEKCTRLKFIDLGFNHITSLASLNQVVDKVTKLILRNNALATTRGLEKLYSLEALDLSHNIISSFHDVELLGSLPVLHSLWLEGNPVSLSCYYREETFSFFTDPTKLILDGKRMMKLESWIVSRIVTRRLKQLSGYGVYVPAKSTGTPSDEAGQPARATVIQHTAGPRRKSSRLAAIDDTGGDKSTGAVESAQQSSQVPVADSETALPGIPEVKELLEPEMVQLIERIETIKREGSSSWLNDLVELMESNGRGPTSANKIEFHSVRENVSSQRKQLHSLKRRRRRKEETRRFPLNVEGHEDNGQAGDMQESVRVSGAGYNGVGDEEGSANSWKAQEERLDDQPVSPPHFDSALLHRRQSLVAELLQLPLDSWSSSSDSDSQTESSALISDSSSSACASPSPAEATVDSIISNIE